MNTKYVPDTIAEIADDLRHTAIAGELARPLMEPEWAAVSESLGMSHAELYRPDARTIEILIAHQDEAGLSLTLREWAERAAVKPHVLLRWIESNPPLKKIWSEAQSYQIEQARMRLIIAAGEGNPLEKSDLATVGSALRMYDPEAKSRSELSGDGGKPVQIVIRNADKPE